MAVLVGWEPWPMARELARNVDRLLRCDVDPWMGMPWQWGVSLREERRWTPAYDMFTRAGDLVVRMELSGIDPATDVQVTVQDGVLYISGARRYDPATEQAGYYWRESNHGAFERGIPLPAGAKIQDITASYDKGVLEVVLPKAALLLEPMRIPVRAGNDTKAVAAGGAKA